MSARQPASEELYVGWRPRAPERTARFARSAAALALLAALAVAVLVAASQATWQPGVFELGVERAFSGTYLHAPCPQLRVRRPGVDAGWSRWLLVQPGKHGGDPAWAALDGLAVELRGALVHRGEGTLIEVAPDSLRPLPGDGRATPGSATRLGSVRLAGEIVDSKCWLGVMNPGNLRAHRACATLCVRGGIPPLLVVRTPQGRAQKVLLVGPRGEALNEAVLPWIALPVEVEGELEAHDDLLVLRADPVAIRVLGP